MTDPTPSDADGFAARIQQLHVPEPNADRERQLLLVGFGLIAVGLVLVALGWYGASGTALVAEQIPYAVSGGAGGLALIVVGAALVMRFSLARLFRFWLARVVYEHQVQTDRTVEALERIEAALTGGTLPPRAASSDDGQGAPARRRKEPLRADSLES